MIFERGGRNWKENVRTKTEGSCAYCNNDVEFEIWGSPAGPYLGYALLPKRAIIGKKAFFLVCPVCEQIRREITKPQVQSLKVS